MNRKIYKYLCLSSKLYNVNNSDDYEKNVAILNSIIRIYNDHINVIGHSYLLRKYITLNNYLDYIFSDNEIIVYLSFYNILKCDISIFTYWFDKNKSFALELEYFIVLKFVRDINKKKHIPDRDAKFELLKKIYNLNVNYFNSYITISDTGYNWTLNLFLS